MSELEEPVISAFSKTAATMDQTAFEAAFGANVARSEAQHVIESDVQMVQSGTSFESAVAMRRLSNIKAASNETSETMDGFLNRSDFQAISRMSQDTNVLSDPVRRFEMYQANNPAFKNVSINSIMDGYNKSLSLRLVRDWSSGTAEDNRALVRLLGKMNIGNKGNLRAYTLFASKGEIDIYDLETELVSKYAMEMPSGWQQSIRKWWEFALNDVGLTAFPFIHQYLIYRRGQQKVPASIVPDSWSMVAQRTSLPVHMTDMCNTRNVGELLDLPSSVDTVEGVRVVSEQTDALGCMRYCDTNSDCHMAQFEGGECYTLEYANPILTSKQLRTMFAPPETPAIAVSQTASEVMYKCDDSVSWRKNQLSHVYGCVDIATGNVDQSLNCAVDPNDPTDAQVRGSCYWPGECPAETPSAACTWDDCPPMEACKRACEAQNLNATPETATHMWKDRLTAARVMTAVGCYAPADVSEEPLYYEPQSNMSTVDVGGDEKGMWPYVAHEKMGACVEGGCEINPRSDYNSEPACTLSGNRWMTATNMQKLSGCWRYMNVDASFSATSAPMQSPLFDSQIVPTPITSADACVRKGYQWFGDNPIPYAPPGVVSLPQHCYGSKESCSIDAVGDTGMTTATKVWIGLLVGVVGLGVLVAIASRSSGGSTNVRRME